MDINNLFGFIIRDGVIAMVTVDAVIDYHNGKMVDAEFASMGENGIILENVSISKRS